MIDYKVSKSLEENDTNINFIQRERHFQIIKNKKLKVFFSRIYFSINNIKEQFSTQFYNKKYGIGL